MSLPLNIEDVLRFMTGFVRSGMETGAWSASITGGVAIIHDWDQAIAGIPQPTEQEINDAANDLTTINGQVFSEWLSENGGDVTLTERRKGVEAVDVPTQYLANLIRAVALVALDEINLLRAQAGLQDRTFTQMRNAIKGKINSGVVDN